MAKEKAARLSVLGLGRSGGIAWAIGVVICGWTSMFGWGNNFVDTMGSIYIGYEASFIGGVIGGVWGFFDGFLFGVLLAFFYTHTTSKVGFGQRESCRNFPIATDLILII